MSDRSDAGTEQRGGRVVARREAEIGYLVFDNPSRMNAISLDMLAEAQDALTEFGADRAVKVIVVTGAGKNFVSGADISRFDSDRATLEAIEAYGRANERVYDLIHGSPKPTIAMIRGYCIGGGLTTAIACDLRICSTTARFSLPAARLGIGYPYKNLKWFVETIGPAFTKEIFLTGRQFDAAEAAQMGLVNRSVPDPVLESFVLDYARTMAGNAPLTMASAKTTIAEILKGPDGDRDLCARLFAECWSSADYIEGRRAFMEKRKPVFTGQ